MPIPYLCRRIKIPKKLIQYKQQQRTEHEFHRRNRFKTIAKSPRASLAKPLARYSAFVDALWPQPLPGPGVDTVAKKLKNRAAVMSEPAPDRKNPNDASLMYNASVYMQVQVSTMAASFYTTYQNLSLTPTARSASIFPSIFSSLHFSTHPVAMVPSSWLLTTSAECSVSRWSSPPVLPSLSPVVAQLQRQTWRHQP
ncbi:uncharacterized protein M421DRAFT_421214 [Didymella exigua CBS 183.55]|uniref:Uncharacterized protein n=1 Tax=Didymella exigua CBS 183.55 TaxID=1150837 RepID=A0A6A5RP00_9PLEO|nr:uncharacterized protein M421DRAFT_421214 [Didymella exigua CBS 183.55]KAF1928016.1 hypothetical protein M421DRAFT_421214 [Didymella exigua CBS 183.55]